MKLNKIFAMATACLGGLLVLQIVAATSQKPQPRYHPSWANLAETLGEGVEQSTQVVLGEVVKVRRAPDIVVKIPGQHGEVDRIPTEVVTIEVQKTYKDREGSVREGSTVEVFHTGLGNQGREQSGRGQRRRAMSIRNLGCGGISLYSWRVVHSQDGRHRRIHPTLCATRNL